MKKLFIIASPFIVLLFAVGLNRLITPNVSRHSTPRIPSPTISKTTNTSPTPSEITATFTIYTNNTKRIFTDERYHGLSEYVYLTADNPSLVHVKKQGTTWNDFFKTLPMEISQTCLLTGTKQEFCTTTTSSLKFYINGIEDKEALGKQINRGDKLVISFGPISDPNLSTQLAN